MAHNKKSRQHATDFFVGGIGKVQTKPGFRNLTGLKNLVVVYIKIPFGNFNCIC